MPTKEKDSVQEPEKVFDDGPSRDEVKAIMEQNKLLMDMLKQSMESKKELELAPPAIINEYIEPIQTPKFVKFRISSRKSNDAMQDGFLVPGKVLTADSVFLGELPLDLEGNYKTGFEVDNLESQTHLRGQELLDLQNEVKIARRYLERRLNQGMGSNNKNFWSTKNIRIENNGLERDTKNSDDMLLYYNILGGAFSDIATSREEAEKKKLYLYLDVAEQEAQYESKYMRDKIEANASLFDVTRNWDTRDKLFLLYAITNNKRGYTLSTPEHFIEAELGGFIEGKDNKGNIKARPREFTDTVELYKSKVSGDRIKAKALLKASEYYNFVRVNKEQEYVLVQNGAKMGSSIEKAVDYLISPSNRDDFAALLANVNDKWSN